jgi:hypothetical protein
MGVIEAHANGRNEFSSTARGCVSASGYLITQIVDCLRVGELGKRKP